jgi:hypothetical protein
LAKTVYLLTKAGEDKTYFNRAGVAFDPNRDGSVNFKLDMFPALTFQIRENTDAKEPEQSGNDNRNARRSR